MSWKQRPSYAELEKKIQQAKAALSHNKCVFGVNPEKLVDEFMELNIGNSEDIWALLQTLLTEIKVEDYAGTHPPMRSIHADKCELYIFVWESKKLAKKMYLKFSIYDEHFSYVSLHKSKRPEKCWRFVDNFQKS